jgi:hypothetical protein
MRPSIRTLFFALVALVACAAGAQPAPLTVAQTIPLPQVTGGMNHFAADDRRDRFFFTATTDKMLLIIDLKSGAVIHTITGYSPAAARFAPDLDLLCVSGAKAVTIYDGDSYKDIGKVELDSSADEMQYDSRTHRLYVGMQDRAAPGIAVIDLAERKLLTRIKLPAPPQGFVLEESGARLFANTPGAKQITVIDCPKQAVAAEWKLTDTVSNYPAALDEKNHRLLIGCRKPSRMLAIDIDSGKTVASTDIGGDTDDMAFDPIARRAYFACGAGEISVIQQDDADHYHALPNIPTTDGARNSLLIPERKEFYVAIPKTAAAPTQLRGYKDAN